MIKGYDAERKKMIRTHTCGELTAGDKGKEVVLCGWVSSRRDHGDIIFMDMRDKHGITQIVFDPKRNADTHAGAHDLRIEYCVKIKGKVSMRPEETVNKKISTGEIEVEADSIDIFSRSETPPFEVKDDIDVSEEVRLKYRYIDLRRDVMQKKLTMKHCVYKFINAFLDEEGFISVETPMLTKSTPEGARDYLVPCRLHEGSFYALPQSPQIFKQLLMVAGVEKYFQIVRCFRDEDLRADRQPEFTQLDMEMSFADENDIMDVCERLFKGLFKEVIGRDIEAPFVRLDYEEAAMRYGSDKPDTRFGVLLNDLTDEAAESDFKIFKEVAASGGKIMALAAPGYAASSRKEIDDLTSFAAEYGAKGLAYFKVEKDSITSPITKFFSPELLEKFRLKTGAKPGDMIFMVADSKETACGALGALRLLIGKKKGLIDKDSFNFLWIINFPLFKFNAEDKRWVSEHHPFTSFKEADGEYIEKKEMGKVRSRSYDLVLNGSEIGSGSIRIHDKDVQKKIFEVLGLSDEECEKKFGFLLEAFKYGPPPHGGVAFGLDRLVSIFTGDPSIREVIPFPKTQKGTCLLTDAPSRVNDEQLRDLGIRLRKDGKNNDK
ncbi:MAG: aspartate--tRNA ligase [Candidatus Omnitrophota bacterium]|nr:aspartate--tRNA ligase [Candidatus Omnitrophota bacterium]